MVLARTWGVMHKEKQLLKEIFGYDDFRPLQEECIRLVLEKKDTLLVMPTGGGKSLCYQIPALIFQGLTVVISPLISLMQDQVAQLKALGICADFLNSSLSWEEYKTNLRLIASGKTKILFLAPETLMKEGILDLLSSANIECFTIDEAHCISDWGHDFRPEYRQLAEVRKRFPNAVCLAMTATATPRVRQDIRQSLNLNGGELVASFNRPNLFYEILPKTAPLQQTIDFINRFPDQSGIIYCFSRKQVDLLAKQLAAKGFSVKPYHAGLADQVRAKNQERFIRDHVRIIVATIAFGMGINKPNVRFVLHYDLPKNPESYYQETGRAGRDGLPSSCLLLFSYGDSRKIRFLIDQKIDPAQKEIATKHLQAMLRYAESTECRRVPLITYFGEDYRETQCRFCDNCATPAATMATAVDLTEPAQKFLSCMFRTGESFGPSHLIDILRGAKTKKIQKFGHEKLSTYGIGTDYSKNQWKALIFQWIQKGLVEQDKVIFGVLRLTEKAWDVLRKKGKVYGTQPPAEIQTATEKVIFQPADHDPKLFELLRKKRRELADQENVPSYIIFSDKSLIDMATRFPQNQQSFAQTFGVGKNKLEKYGKIFTQLIKEYKEGSLFFEEPTRKESEQATAEK